MTTTTKRKRPRPVREQVGKIHDGLITLREGAYAKALRDVARVDAVITDPPYSSKTHEGNAKGTFNDGSERGQIDYSSWSRKDVRRFVRHWHPRCHGWIVAFCDHKLIPVWEAELERVGRYAFAGMPVIIPGMTCRTLGDGPSREAVYLVAGRMRTASGAAWRTLPGWYKATQDRWSSVVGGKPLSLMEKIVEDYSNPGDLVCDPCAGHGTTLFAAARLGRYAVGSELDPETYKGADERLRQSLQPALFTLHENRRAAPPPPAQQAGFDLVERSEVDA